MNEHDGPHGRTPGGPRTRYGDARGRVAAAIRGGAGLKAIDRDVIEQQPMSRDARDALWLYAWATMEQGQIREWARTWRR
jgi:hypothetical protein